MTTRREFLGRLAGGSVAVLVTAHRIGAQQQRRVMHDSTIARDTTNLFAMDQSAAQPVRLPPKPGATPLLTAAERDDLEHRIHCQCGCTLDVYTCRTTDFSCQVSPAMHRDVMELVRGGYSAQEIIDAFVGTYGERALMAPRKSGFNLLAWFAPGTAVLIGAGALIVLVRRWGRTGASNASRRASSVVATDVDATPEELRRLEAAVRGDRPE
jgi:cytochrome c-type biogenesis protein CcmH